VNSRERVLTALNHKVPDRVPIDFGSFSGATSINVRAYQNLLGYLGMGREPRVENSMIFTAAIDDDILDRFRVDTKSVKPSIPLKEFDAPLEFYDRPWEVKWQRSDDFTYAPVKGPFQKRIDPSVDDLKKFKWPSPFELEDPARWKEKAKKTRQESDRALVGRLPMGIVSLAQILRGFEGWATDLILNRKFSEALHEKLAEIWIETSEAIVDAIGENVDIVYFGDDYGTQNQTMLSPQMFRERIKPLLRRMIQSVKARTKAKIVLHSCGSVFNLIEDFIDVGIDALNPLQANATHMEPERIKKIAGKDLTLWGGIDTHVVLPKGDPADVREEVRKKISALGEGGGYILSADHNILLDVPPENLIAMFEAAFEYGKY
jgi:uroporphyrinogen decarboxylase